MNVILIPLFRVLNIAIELYIWALIVSALLSWLTAFNVINMRNQFVYTVSDMLQRITEPALRPIRRFMGRLLPSMGGVDLSPVVLILILIFLQNVLGQLLVTTLM